MDEEIRVLKDGNNRYRAERDKERSRRKTTEEENRKLHEELAELKDKKAAITTARDF